MQSKVTGNFSEGTQESAGINVQWYAKFERGTAQILNLSSLLSANGQLKQTDVYLERYRLFFLGQKTCECSVCVSVLSETKVSNFSICSESQFCL